MIHPTKCVPFSESCQSISVAAGPLNAGLRCGHSRLKVPLGDTTREVPELERAARTPREYRLAVSGYGDAVYRIGVPVEGAKLFSARPVPELERLVPPRGERGIAALRTGPECAAKLSNAEAV